jgi:hypothetical protein
MLPRPASASPDWWNQAWSCRKAITVTESSGAALTDYQVKIDLSYEPSMLPDFGDLRFTNASGSLLDYWLESKTDGDSATVWVEVDDIAASADTVIYMYYSNPSASSASDGASTFIFFDDFSGDLSQWEIQSASGVYPRIESGYLRCGGGTTGSPYGWTCLGSEPTYNSFQDNAIEFRYRVASNAICEVSFRGNYDSNTGYKGRSDQRSGEGQSFLKPPYRVGQWNFITSRDGDRPSVGVWYRGTITATGSTFKLYRDGVLKRTGGDSQYGGPGQISLQNHYGSYTDYDWVAVRNFTDPEPTYTIGAEECLPTVGIAVSDPLINEADVGGSFDVVATFSKAMNTGVIPTISFDPDVEASGTLVFASGSWSVGDTIYTASYDIADVDEEVTNVDVSVAGAEDPAGNRQNPDPTTEADLFDVDTSAPTVDITSTATDPTNISPIPMTATFSDDVTGFELGDITVGNGTAGNLAGIGSVYTFDVTPVADGLVTVDIAAGVAQDAAGNDNTAATQFSIAYDSTGQTGGTAKDKYYTNDDVRITASGFLPGSDVDVYVVRDYEWADGDEIPPDGGDIFAHVLLTANDDGEIGGVIWEAPLKIGEYDVAFDADRNGIYDELWDLVDHPNHPGFTVVATTVGGTVYPIDKAALLLPWLFSSAALLLTLAASGLILIRRADRLREP